MRAAARTFPVRAAASSSTSSFAPPPTSSSAQTASELGADFGAGADSDFGTGTGKASTRLCVPPPATPAFRRSCFSRSISAVARELSPSPQCPWTRVLQHRIQQRARRHPAEGTKQTPANLGVHDMPTRTAAFSPATTQRGPARSFPRARFRRAGPRESGIRRAPSPTPPCRSP